MTVTLRGQGLTEDQVVAVARQGENVALAASARTRMESSRARVERAAASREPVYGVSTGFGALAGTRVAPLRQPELQLALIRSHAAGVGPPVDDEVVRATMLLRARTLAMGMSGARPLLAEAWLRCLRRLSLCCAGWSQPHLPGGALLDRRPRSHRSGSCLVGIFLDRRGDAPQMAGPGQVKNKGSAFAQGSGVAGHDI